MSVYSEFDVPRLDDASESNSLAHVFEPLDVEAPSNVNRTDFFCQDAIISHEDTEMVMGLLHNAVRKSRSDSIGSFAFSLDSRMGRADSLDYGGLGSLGRFDSIDSVGSLEFDVLPDSQAPRATSSQAAKRKRSDSDVVGTVRGEGESGGMDGLKITTPVTSANPSGSTAQKERSKKGSKQPKQKHGGPNVPKNTPEGQSQGAVSSNAPTPSEYALISRKAPRGKMMDSGRFGAVPDKRARKDSDSSKNSSDCDDYSPASSHSEMDISEESTYPEEENDDCSPLPTRAEHGESRKRGSHTSKTNSNSAQRKTSVTVGLQCEMDTSKTVLHMKQEELSRLQSKIATLENDIQSGRRHSANSDAGSDPRPTSPAGQSWKSSIASQSPRSGTAGHSPRSGTAGHSPNVLNVSNQASYPMQRANSVARVEPCRRHQSMQRSISSVSLTSLSSSGGLGGHRFHRVEHTPQSFSARISQPRARAHPTVQRCIGRTPLGQVPRLPPSNIPPSNIRGSAPFNSKQRHFQQSYSSNAARSRAPPMHAISSAPYHIVKRERNVHRNMPGNVGSTSAATDYYRHASRAIAPRVEQPHGGKKPPAIDFSEVPDPELRRRLQCTAMDYFAQGSQKNHHVVKRMRLSQNSSSYSLFRRSISEDSVVSNGGMSRSSHGLSNGAVRRPQHYSSHGSWHQ